MPDRQVHHAHRVLDRDALHPPPLMVLLGAPQAGHDQRCLAVYQVAAVELGADLDGELAVAQRLGTVYSVSGCCQSEIAAHADEYFDLAVVHRRGSISTVSSPCSRGGVDVADLVPAGRANSLAGRWSMPQVRLPWTLLWPRTGTGRPLRCRYCRAAAAG